MQTDMNGITYIQAKNIVSSYGRLSVLKGVDISADAGQCVGIVGRNGCGKSTLLDILAGIKKADSGEIMLIGGKTAADCTGYVPQESCLIEELSVIDNLRLWYRDRRELKTQLESGFLKELGIDKMCKKRAGKLSGGMKKRVSIGCALSGNPPVLILDEPCAALDLAGKAELYAFISKYKSNGGAVLIATHDEGDLELCDKLYALKDGKAAELDCTLRGARLVERIV